MSQLEDRRAAVHIATTLSQAIMAADLAVLAIVGTAYLQFFTSSKSGSTPRMFLGALAACSLISFVASIYCGGRGIQAACASGAQGVWSLEVSKGWYSMQATLALAGLLLFSSLLVAFGARIGSDQPTPSIDVCQAGQLTESLSTTLAEIEALKKVLDGVELGRKSETSDAKP